MFTATSQENGNSQVSARNYFTEVAVTTMLAKRKMVVQHLLSTKQTFWPTV